MEGVDRRQACEQGRVASSPLPSMGTWGLIAPGGLRDRGPRTPLAPGSPARPARPASDPTRAPTGRPPSPRGAAWLAPPQAGKGSWGAYLRGPRAARRAPGRRRATGGRGPRAAPSRRTVSGARAELYLRGPLPACAPQSLERGGAPRDTTGRGTSATRSCCAGSEPARLRAPRPCRRQSGPGVGGPLPCLQIWSLVSLGGEGSSGQQAEGIEWQDLGWP